MRNLEHCLPTRTSILFVRSIAATVKLALAAVAAFMFALNPIAHAQSPPTSEPSIDFHPGLIGEGWRAWAGDGLTVLAWKNADGTKVHCFYASVSDQTDADLGAFLRDVQARLEANPPGPDETGAQWLTRQFINVFVRGFFKITDDHPGNPICSSMRNIMLGAPPVYIAAGLPIYEGFVNADARGTQVGVSTRGDACQCEPQPDGAGGVTCRSVSPVSAWDRVLDFLWLPLEGNPAQVTYCTRPR